MTSFLPMLRQFTGAVLLSATAIAVAQPKPALVRDLDEPGRDPFFVALDVVVGSSECNQGGSTTTCSIQMGSAPSGKRLVITYASAVFDLADASATNPWVELTMGAGKRITLPLSPARGTGTRVIAAGPVMAFADPGPIVQMHVRASALSPTSVIATVVGYYIAVP